MKVLLAILVVYSALLSQAQTEKTISLIPMPAQVQMGSGQLVIAPYSFTVSVAGDARLRRGVDRFLSDLRRQTGTSLLNFKVVEGAATLAVSAERPSKEIPELGEDESYTLEITSSGAKLTAPTTLGALHGLQTFLQLVGTTAQGLAVPALSVKDTPRFPWRGLMIDVSRHFIPLDVLRRNLDGMAAVKLNVFHWHLSENQGFRIESKKFPKLQQMGSDGLFYTQAEVKDLIAYAADRGIRVIPEFDMPGHSTAWFVGYPELASGAGPYEIERHWGVFDPAMDPTRESTYKFLDVLIGEMTRLFPDAYFHIGGDEVNGKEWDANPKIAEFKRAHNFKTNDELQAYFSGRVQKIVSKHGKITVGWDEVLQPDVPKDIVIQSWRGQDSLAEAAKRGYSGLLSNGYYLDLMWPTYRHYAVDPMTGATANLSADEKKHILGGEACMWSEHVSPENMDSRIWPRMAAIAERYWSPQATTDVPSMYARMADESRRLDWLGLNHNSGYDPMLRRIAGSEDIGALRALTDVVEPVKDYEREQLAVERPHGALPLNRVVDAARPESLEARRFAELVDAFTSGKIAPGVEDEIRAKLARWRRNEVDLTPQASESSFVQEVMPLSKDLSAIAAGGLEALEYLDRGQGASADWKARQIAALAEAAKPKAQIMLMIVPSVQKLIDAAAGQPVSARVQ